MKPENRMFLKSLTDIDCSAQLVYAAGIDNFYISTRLMHKDGIFLVGICGHNSTPDGAVESFRDQIKGRKMVMDTSHGRETYCFV